MFHSAALKLTLWYLAIVMALSISLSVVIYRFAVNELAQNTRRQVYFFNNQLDSSDFNSFSRLRQRQLNQGRNRLQGDFILFNLLVLVGGGALSYALARRTLEPIESSLEAQKRFTGDASHELRTPLAAIQSEVEVALRDPNLTKAQAKDLLKSNLEEVAKLKALSDGLLHLTSTDIMKLDEIVALPEISKQAIERWSKIAKAKKITIEAELSEVYTQGDAQSLVDLASILLDNALKYSPSGSHLKISTYRQDRGAYLSVEDQGQGIRAADLPHIFDRFYRTDQSRSKKDAEGYGLGLAIAKQIAERHDGYIEVKSTLGKGSIFTVHLPRANLKK